jgi:hypothetical protein
VAVIGASPTAALAFEAGSNPISGDSIILSRDTLQLR